ncbi:MAG TPA: hypothetical protein PKC89_10655 [Pyrinomonadaceae bacterium]|nr:hypothetical protein [Pyrinomonadaceae bacterium]
MFRTQIELIGRICADRSTRESVTSARSAGSAFGSLVEGESWVAMKIQHDSQYSFERGWN